MKYHLIVGALSFLGGAGYLAVDFNSPENNITEGEAHIERLNAGVQSSTVLSGLPKTINLGPQEPKPPVAKNVGLSVQDLAEAYDRGNGRPVLPDGTPYRPTQKLSPELEGEMKNWLDSLVERYFGRVQFPDTLDMKVWGRWWANVEITEAGLERLRQQLVADLNGRSEKFEEILRNHGPEVKKLLIDHLGKVFCENNSVISEPQKFSQVSDLIWTQMPLAVQAIGREKVGYDAFMEVVRQDVHKNMRF